MKKTILGFLDCLALIFTVLGVTGCGGRSLRAPADVRVDPVTLTLSWRAVGGAAYYTVEIDGDDGRAEMDSGKNTYSLERLEPGKYTARIKAVAGSDGDAGDSGWSERVSFEREAECGLVFALTSAGDSFEVTGIGSATGDITVPDTYRGLPVIGIADRAFYNKSAVTSVSLGENIKYIGSMTFANCSYLEKINLPVSLTSIGEGAFQSCRVLASDIVIPEGVTGIPARTFQYCRKLPSVRIGSGVRTVGESAFEGCETLTKIAVPDGVTILGDSAFARCTRLSDISLGTGVTVYPANLFRGCTAVASFTVGDGVTGIGGYAFSGCTALTEISMGDSVLSIGDFAFDGCTSLGSVWHMSTFLTSVGQYAFRDTLFFTAEGTDDTVYVGGWFLGCKSGKMRGQTIADGTVGIADFALYKCGEFDDILTLPASLRYIGKSAFSNCGKLTGVIIGSGVLEIGDEAFIGCTALSGLFLGDYTGTTLGDSSLTKIGDYAFGACSSLSSVIIPPTVTKIGSHAFRDSGIYKNASREVYAGSWIVDCVSSGAYGTVAIEDGTVGIADYAFNACKGISSVVIPDSVKYIGRSAFYKCEGLTSATLPQGLTEIPDYLFYGCTSLEMPALPDSVFRIGRSAFYKCRLVSDGSESGDNSLVIPSSVREIGDYAFYGCTYTYTDESGEKKNGGIDILVIGSGTVSIGRQAFSGMLSLREVTLGYSLSEIGEKAFYKCTALSSVTFSDGLKVIGDKAFYGCTALTAAHLPGTLTDIGNYAFYRCTSLAVLDLGGTTRIGNSAFLGCTALTSLKIPASLDIIGAQAFRGCTGLTSVIIPETLGNVGAHAFYGCRGLTLYIESTTLPEGFDARWNSSYRPAVYGVKHDGDRVVSFTYSKDRAENLDGTYRLSDPSADGYVFAGWATEPDGDAVYTSATVTDADDGTALYAIYTPAG